MYSTWKSWSGDFISIHTFYVNTLLPILDTMTYEKKNINSAFGGDLNFNGQRGSIFTGRKYPILEMAFET